MVIFSFGFVLLGLFVFWLATLDLPDFSNFEERVSLNSTKIYDRSGEVLLYDTNKDIQRIEVSSDKIDQDIKNAFVSIEDKYFYEHNGIVLKSILRSLLENLKTTSLSQGGSTITQQVIKNTLLNKEKTIVRKIKEVVLAIKLDKTMSKDSILTIYLNDAPFGGTVYGIEEASRVFFGKNAQDVSMAEAAYLASIPNAPTHYSPYGKYVDDLEKRKNLVINLMYEQGYISFEDAESAKTEVVSFKTQEKKSIKAPHFVFYVLDYLENKYGTETLNTSGFKVITTLDWELQEKAEEIVHENAFKNKESWDAENQGLVAIDPKTGQIITMVGSRDYFDSEIDGAYNVATALRQPGSSFKPFVYYTAFKKGYTPDTVVFDVKTEFNSSCYLGENRDTCYSPSNYDGLYKGPINLRNALAQSRNIPAVKMLYLVGVDNSIKTARDMGISTLTSGERYGLTLVLGGGEVTLLDMVSSYGVFATGGIRQDKTAILLIEDNKGNVIEKYTANPNQVIDKNEALMVSDILSDNEARTPLFGSRSFLYFGEIGVAGKTGTTNNNRDAWLIGYTPNLVVGVWSGNNDNSPMKKGSSISGPSWRSYMDIASKKYPIEEFEKPYYSYTGNYNLKPVLRGVWQGSETYLIDSASGGLATDLTPKETLVERVVPNIHSILHWVDKNDPLGLVPENQTDPQYKNWESAVQSWWSANYYLYNSNIVLTPPTYYDNIHTIDTQTEIEIKEKETIKYSDIMKLDFSIKTDYPVKKVELFVGGVYVGTDNTYPYEVSFNAKDVVVEGSYNIFTAVVYDIYYNKGVDEESLLVN